MCDKFEVNILSQGERLKNLRKSLGLKQTELSGNDITRNMISMIENNKAPLTIKSSKLIYNNLMQSLRKRGLEYETSPEEIYLTEEEQVRRISERYIEYLEENRVEKFKNFPGFKNLDVIMDVINKYKVNDCKMKVYFYLAKYYQFNLDYNKAFRYFSIVNELVLSEDADNEFISQLMIAILDVARNTQRYEEGLLISDRFIDRIEINYLVTFMHNRIIILKKLNRIKEVLEEIRKFESIPEKILREHSFHIIAMAILKANCLREQNKYKQAIDIYFHLLEDIVWHDKNIHHKALVLTNIIETYLDTGDNYLEYLFKLDNLIDTYPSLHNYRFMCELCKHVYDAYDNLKDERYNELKDKYLKKIISSSMKYKLHNFLSFALNKLLDDAKISKDEEKVESIKEDIFKALNNGMLKLDSLLVYNLIEYYNSINNSEKISEIIYFIRNLNKERGA
ncbi:helix-turn-helix transcriptional regulator [Oceanirhabdus sp. W0125-5]|uniref:helix-turn-helix transcriptional regulator n=1 Tax=Oceanirhabdus sp. W0125-5 TaxID=2999116 RepID=UPI0022F331BB|nr:helix-turn-helix transcriptional regulator [Oceanirhabdus sp. W0125-5]WBW95166.1 hypothetical protein OW730_15895 [Oceanirhabdus sp. W0125-5]